jgi:hypothetical protein
VACRERTIAEFHQSFLIKRAHFAAVFSAF